MNRISRNPPMARKASLLALLFSTVALPAMAQSVPPPQIQDLIPDWADYVAAPGPITFNSPQATTAFQGCLYVAGTTPPASCPGGPLPPSTSSAYDGDGRLIATSLENNQAFTFANVYAIVDTQVINTTLVGGGITANVRIAGTGAPLSSATALTLDAAVAQARAGADLSGIRGRILPGIVTASGVAQSTVITGSSSVVTNRAETDVQVTVFGPATTTFAATGQCNATFTQCEASYTHRALDGTENFYQQHRLTLATTTTIQQTVTSTGTVTVDIPVAAPGLAHPGVQVAGFDQSDRFLQRLSAPGAAGLGMPMGDDGWSMFLEATGARGDVGQDGGASPARYEFGGLRGGVSHAAGRGLTLGLAIEGGRQDWSTADVFYREAAEGSGVRVGGFAAWTPGTIRIGLGAFVGRQEVDTTGTSLAGAGVSRASFTATTWGVGGSAAWPVEAGNWTLTPSLGVAVLGWSSDGYTERGGLAPLTVEGADRTQVRPEVGLDIARRFDLGGEASLVLGANARAFAVTGDEDGAVTASDGVAGSFDITAPGQGASGGDLGAYAAVSLGPNTTLTAAWSHRFNQAGEDSDAALLQLRIAF